jgi:hypothetical protein
MATTGSFIIASVSQRAIGDDPRGLPTAEPTIRQELLGRLSHSEARGYGFTVWLPVLSAWSSRVRRAMPSKVAAPGLSLWHVADA